jgi:hypothetical protein
MKKPKKGRYIEESCAGGTKRLTHLAKIIAYWKQAIRPY